jgi:glyoxylase-like metal-dependent hydrolase (beta-lactamase superfamily II)
MHSYICVTCGTQFPESAEPPGECPVCEDERQYVPERGQQWTTLDELRVSHRAEVREELPGLLGIGCEPSFAIGQRALLADGVLWDCQALLNDEIALAVGSLDAIAISHPHYYTTMIEWAHWFGCPVYIHADDRKWVMRPDDAVVFWKGESFELKTGLTLVRLGGHFPGGQVLHWAEEGMLLTGDIVYVVPDRRYVSFMYSYPNLIPLPAQTVLEMARRLAAWDFERIVGAWWGTVVREDGKEVVRRSIDRYVAAVDGTRVGATAIPDELSSHGFCDPTSAEQHD